MARTLFAGLISAVLLLTIPVITAQTIPTLLASADNLYQTGAFDRAADEYRQIITREPTNLAAQRDLVRALLKGEHPDEAAAVAAKAITLAPHDVPLMVLLGDVYFRQARFDASKMLYLTALTVDPNSASAYAGLGRLMLTESNDRQAMRDFSRACSSGPVDIDNLLSCARMAKDRARKVELLERYLAAAPHNDPDAFRGANERLKIEQFLAGRKTFVCSGPERGSVKLDAIRPGPYTVRGLRIPVSLNGHKPVWLVLDTGAGGSLLLNRRVADKLGVKPFLVSEVKGLGGAGSESAHVGWADSIRIGDFEFRNCIVGYTDRNVDSDTAGLLGATIFSRYLVAINYPESRLDLSPLPPIHPMKLAGDHSADMPNGIIPIGLEHFTRVRKFGGHLLIPTAVNGLSGPYFIIDTGSQDNLISERLARRIGGLNASRRVVKGVTGKISQVYYAKGRVTLRFADFEQPNSDLTSISLDAMSKNMGVEISGIIGQPILRYLMLVIDYRDGLVDFVYDKKTAPM